jgi:hypothetical protein
MFHAKPLPGAPQGGHDLIGNQEDFILVADLADDGKVPIMGGNSAQGCANNGLGNECGNVIRIFLENDPLQIPGAFKFAVLGNLLGRDSDSSNMGGCAGS